jgi:hypothetical protein
MTGGARFIRLDPALRDAKPALHFHGWIAGAN